MIKLRTLRSFLDLTGYYRRFFKNYGNIVAPLTTLLKKNAFGWSQEAEQAFAALKTGMATPLVLGLPNFSKPFVIECNASGFGLGAILM